MIKEISITLFQRHLQTIWIAGFFLLLYIVYKYYYYDLCTLHEVYQSWNKTVINIYIWVKRFFFYIHVLLYSNLLTFENGKWQKKYSIRQIRTKIKVQRWNRDLVSPSPKKNLVQGHIIPCTYSHFFVKSEPDWHKERSNIVKTRNKKNMTLRLTRDLVQGHWSPLTYCHSIGWGKFD